MYIYVYFIYPFKVDVMPKYQQTGRMIGLSASEHGKESFSMNEP